ncbi:MAG: SDR family NAD(P)-dependent oxidoreductase [Alphaproteobacteria bacterium]
MMSLVVGASAGLGRALAQELARAGHTLFLIATDERDLMATAADLRIRFGVRVAYLAVDLAAADIDALRGAVLEDLGRIDNLFLIAGWSAHEDGSHIPTAVARRLLAVNGTEGILLVNAFLPDLVASRGNLVGAGSVAGVRGRRKNALYGAAKRGLETWFESARHALAQSGSGCRVQFYRLGYLATSMVAGQKLLFPPLAPDVAARRIVANLDRDIGTRYLPWWWWPIMTMLRLLPWPLFKRLDI